MTGIGLVRTVLVLVAASGVLAATARAADENDALGKWKLTYEPGDGRHESVLTVTKDGQALKGEWVDDDDKGTVKDLKFKDGKLSFKREGEYNGEPFSVTFEGKVKGDSIEGEGKWEYQGMSGTFTFEGKREAAKPKE
jgi:hypothetical protein